MNKLGKIALVAVGFNLLLAGLHGWLNLGYDPAQILSFGKGGKVAGGDPVPGRLPPRDVTPHVPRHRLDQQEHGRQGVLRTREVQRFS